MKTLSRNNLERIGFVNKASGFKGLLSCIIESGKPEIVAKKKFLFILQEGLPVPYAIEEAEVNGQEVFIKFEDIDTEEQARQLSRKDIFIEKTSKRKKTEVVTWTDLAGFMAIDETHGEIGVIEEVVEYPMQFIAKCTVKGKEVLFPLNEEIVTDIDMDERKIMLELPEGLIDIYLE
jgi:16S rRNA processing protein RimM